MTQRLIPGLGYVDETGSAQRLIPGIGYIDETESSPASCSISWTEADDTASISVNIGNGLFCAISWTEANDVSSFEGAISSPSFTTEPLINNTGTILSEQAVVWSWFPSGRIGSMDSVAVTDGAGITGPDGTLTVTGILAGSGILMVAVLATDAADDAVYYEAGTVS